MKEALKIEFSQSLLQYSPPNEGCSTIHSVAYANDVVRVSVKKVIDPDTEVPYPISEI